MGFAMKKINTVILILTIFVLLTPLVEGSCLTITTQPSSQAVCIGNTATFTVAASGSPTGYQWQYSIDSGSTWSNVSGGNGANTNQYTIDSVTSNMNTWRYRVIVYGGTSCPNGVASNGAATLTVNTAITTQPQSATVCIGSTTTFTVAASGSSLSYQWQYSTDGGSTWSSVSGGSGGTTASYKTSSATTGMNNYQYRVVITKSGCSQGTTSNAATLTVNPTITTQPQSATVCVGSTATFIVVASGSSLSYQWQYYSSSTWVSVTDGSGGTTSSYTTSSATTGMNGRQYRVVVTGGSCSTKATSSTVTLTVNSPPTITTQPASQPVCVGSTATFTVVASGSSLTYQWQYSTDGGSTWSSVSGGSGGTTSSYTTSSATTGMSNYQYRVVVNSGSCQVTSNAATLTVNSPPTITTQPTSQPVCVGSTATFTVVASGSSLTYQWQLEH